MRCASQREWAQQEQLPSQGDYPSTTEYTGCLKALDPKVCADVMELYVGSPPLAATDHPSEMKAEVQET